MDYVPAKILTKQSSSVYSPNIDGMSGYALAVSSRQDRVDYSVTKGGWRLWLSVIVFMFLVAGFASLISHKEATDLDSDEELQDESIDAYNTFVDMSRIKEYSGKVTKPSDYEEEETEEPEMNTLGEVHEGLDQNHEGEEQYQLLIGEEERRLMQLAKKAERKKATAKTPYEQKQKIIYDRKNMEELEEPEIEPESELEPENEKLGEEKVEEVEKDEEKERESIFDFKKIKKKLKEVFKHKKDEKQTASTTEKSKKQIKVIRTKGKPKETPTQTIGVEDSGGTVVEEGEVHHVIPERKLDQSEKVRVPVKVHRRKGKSKEDNIEDMHEYKEKRDLYIKAIEDEEMVPEESLDEEKIKIPVKVRRTKGKTLDELKIAFDHEELPMKNFISPKPRIPVKYHRRKGRDIKSEKPQQTFVKKILTKKVTEAEEETCPAGTSCDDDQLPVTSKTLIPVRYTRKKGVDLEKEEKIVEASSSIEKQSSKPVIPIKIYKTKGKDENVEETAEKIEDKKDEKQVQILNDDKKQKAAEHQKKSKTVKKSTHAEYKNKKITNKEDNKIRNKLDAADHLLDERNLDTALEEYNQILKLYPQSPRAHYGRAKTLDLISDMKQSNKILEESIREYEMVLELPNVPEDLYLLAANRLIDRLKFRGWIKKALFVQQNLTDKFPDDLKMLNDFGVTFLIMGRTGDAKKIFETVLTKEPDNGFAMALYGFILKTAENRLNESIKYLRHGIESGENGTLDARFFFHLGDALQRLDRADEAYEIYEKGVENGLFLSKFQRSLYNVPGLRAKPWWTVDETTYSYYLKMIENDWRTIKDEGLALLDKKNLVFELEDEKLTDKGDWRQFTLFRRGQKVTENCAKAPKTCSLLEKFTDAVTCKRGQIKFSVMEGGTKVWPHCGPTNCRLRGHLGLIVPPDPRIRVGNETRAWKRGKFIIFDDSFEHEVWYAGSGYRLVLIVDFWHPDLTAQQKSSLAPI